MRGLLIAQTAGRNRIRESGRGGSCGESDSRSRASSQTRAGATTQTFESRQSTWLRRAMTVQRIRCNLAVIKSEILQPGASESSVSPVPYRHSCASAATRPGSLSGAPSTLPREAEPCAGSGTPTDQSLRCVDNLKASLLARPGCFGRRRSCRRSRPPRASAALMSCQRRQRGSCVMTLDLAFLCANWLVGLSRIAQICSGQRAGSNPLVLPSK